jgi:shikimate dehydrogenase
MQYGLIGEKLGHSFSKEIHNRIDNYPYEIREIPRDELDSFMKSKDFVAINVTIPYKQAVIPYLDYIHPAAEEINAVNTIVNKDGKLLGYNTDFAGMSKLSERIGIDFQGKKVLILGTGGTSKTAVAVAKSKNASAIL